MELGQAFEWSGSLNLVHWRAVDERVSVTAQARQQGERMIHTLLNNLLRLSLGLHSSLVSTGQSHHPLRRTSRRV